MGPRTGTATVLDPASGARDSDFAQATGGNVLAATSDGDGGWFIGGTFTAVESIPRPYLAHVLADGSLDRSWQPVVNGAVNAMVRDGDTLYVGGAFTSVAGLTRNRIAALRTGGAGGPTSWDANASAAVSTLAIDGTTLYAGGAFTTIGGATRNRLAALDMTDDSAAATTWNPNVNGTVNVLRIDGTTLFAGGAFTSIGGTIRNRVAALDMTLDTGNVQAFNPNAQSTVADLVVAGGSVYLAGAFTTIGGQAHASLARVDAITGAPSSWNPTPSSAPTALETDGATVFVAGSFTTIAGQPRSGLAAFGVADDTLTEWDPTAIGAVLELARAEDGQLMTGGSFTSVNAVRRSRLAAVDLTTGEATSWSPAPNNTVAALDVHDGVVYAGGAFTAVGVDPRGRTAAFDAITGATLAWNPNASSTVATIDATDDGIYVGGAFTTIGLQARNRLARVNAITGLADDWNPNINGAVGALMSTPEGVYVGGAFTLAGATPRNRVARLDATTALADGWDPDASTTVSTLARDSRGIYVGGSFVTIGGAARSRLARIDATSGLADGWNPSPNNIVNAVSVGGDTVFVGGTFTSVAGVSRGRVAALDAGQDTGNALDWNPNPSATVTAIRAIDASTVLLGGSFTSFTTPITAQTFHALFIAPPVATGAPTLSGVAQVGEELRCSAGSWDGIPNTYTYAWYVGVELRVGATNSSYRPGASDAGRMIRCEVSARNLTAKSVEPSPAASVLPAAPVGLDPPHVDGHARAGSIVACVGATWGGAINGTSYRWFGDGTVLADATTQTLRLDAGHVGHGIHCEVTAWNPGGARTARSTAVHAEAAATPLAQADPLITPTGPRLVQAGRLRAVALAGSRLTCPKATWSEPPLTRTVHWLVDDRLLAGATSTTLRTTGRMIGHSVSCISTAYGAGGSAAARSTAARVIPTSEVSLVLRGMQSSRGKLPSARRGTRILARGLVRDDRGRPVSRTLVTIYAGTRVVAAGATDARGRYKIKLVASTTLRLHARTSGTRSRNVSLPTSRPATLRVR